MRIKKHFITLHSALGYAAGGGVFFWSAWLIITFAEKYIGLWWANILGNVVGITLNYIFQRYLAFPGKGILSSGGRYILFSASNLFLSYIVLRLLTAQGIDLWFAQFISAAIFTVWNYVWYKLWVFKVKVKNAR